MLIRTTPRHHSAAETSQTSGLRLNRRGEIPHGGVIRPASIGRLKEQSGLVAYLRGAGMIGGIGPPSTVDYYNLIIAGYQERHGEATSPRIIINSLNLFEIIPLLEDRLDELADVLTVEVGRLAAADADFGFRAANTAHLVFDEVEEESSIPLVSIVDATCAEAVRLGMRRLGLFGTRFTMQSGMYQEKLAARGTEIPLLLGDDHGISVPLLNTTQIHVDLIVDLLED